MENFDTYINNIEPDSRHPLYWCAECVKRCLRHMPGRLLAIIGQASGLWRNRTMPVEETTG